MLLKFLFYLLSLTPAFLAANEHPFAKNPHAQPTKLHFQYASSLQQQQHHSQHNTVPITYEKEYFYFSAPEEDAFETEDLKNLLNSFKKRQQVIFIKTPMNAAYEKALENFLQDSAEKETHIYIFSQGSNYDKLLQKFQQNINHKPEVHFVKYRYPAEVQGLHSAIFEQFGAASDVKPAFALSPAIQNTPVSKNYAKNFLPKGIDVKPGSSYIPLFLL